MISIIFAALFFSACAWSMFCSHRTYVQRSPLWGRLYDIGVSFDAHYWRLLTFRNPWEIYPDIVRVQMGPV